MYIKIFAYWNHANYNQQTMLLVFILALLISFYLLAVICDEFFVPALDRIAHRLKMSSDVAGATLMAVGSSAPELFTSLFAVFKPGDHADVGAGTIVGSAIFNILVIIGASAAFKRAKLTWQPVIRDTIFYCFSILLLLFVFRDGTINLAESVYFLSLYVVYILAVVNWKKILPYEDTDIIEELEEESRKSKLATLSRQLLSYLIPDVKERPHMYVSAFLMSIVWIAVLSYVLVESAVGLGTLLNINPTIIALTVLASGTSIPDLLSSVIVAKQGRGDMAVSNAIGSNIFDILFGLGFPWFLLLALKGETITISTENLYSSIFLLFATVVAILFVLIVRKWTIGVKSGLILIGMYVLYLVYNITLVIQG